MFPPRLLRNASIVTPDATLPDSALLIDRGRIAAIGPAHQLERAAGEVGAEIIDLDGAFVLPGLIDLHTDTLEKEITPRPAADFPIDVAVHELDRKLVGCGITTVYHSLHFGYQEADRHSRSRFQRRDIVAGVRALAAGHTLARTRIHARFEIAGGGPAARPLVEELLEDGAFDLLSFMDHTPGQGQYTRERFIEDQRRQGRTEDQAMQSLRERQERPRLGTSELAEIARRARDLGVPVASHDDDTPEKVRGMREIGVTISEFPINLESATMAHQLGLAVLGGASNVLRGGSLTGNLDVTAAIRAGVLRGLCSDYYPPAMLHAVFKLAREGVLPLHTSAAAASLVPARAAGMDDETGSLEVGKEADIVVVRMRGTTPTVLQTYVRGERVHTAGRERHASTSLAHSLEH